MLLVLMQLFPGMCTNICCLQQFGDVATSANVKLLLKVGCTFVYDDRILQMHGAKWPAELLQGRRDMCIQVA